MLKLAIPKGSLESQTLKLFEQADLTIQRESENSYYASIDDPRIEKVTILRAQEIPKYVTEGYFDLGIAGLDWIKETESKVIEVADLLYSKTGFKKVKIVVAVGEKNNIVNPNQIRPGSKVVTEYPNLTKKYFQTLGIPVNVIFSYGATEAKIPEIADVLVDLCESGQTLRTQGGKIIDTILESTTKLVANPTTYSDLKKKKAIEDIKILLLGVLRAEDQILIKLNVRKEKLNGVIKILPAMRSPTISELYGNKGEWYAVETVVPKNRVNLLIPRLKEAGACDILELWMTKVIP